MLSRIGKAINVKKKTIKGQCHSSKRTALIVLNACLDFG